MWVTPKLIKISILLFTLRLMYIPDSNSFAATTTGIKENILKESDKIPDGYQKVYNSSRLIVMIR